MGCGCGAKRSGGSRQVVRVRPRSNGNVANTPTRRTTTPTKRTIVRRPFR